MYRRISGHEVSSKQHVRKKNKLVKLLVKYLTFSWSGILRAS